MKKGSWFFGLLLTAACNYNHIKESTGDKARADRNDPQKLGALDFASVQRSVLGPRCVSCHSDATGNKGGANLETYQNVRRLMGRISFRTFEKIDMPPGSPLSDREATLLRNWLDIGAPEINLDFDGAADPALEQGPTDWNKINQKVFVLKCLDCHSQPEPQGQLDLNSYEQVKEKAAVIFDRVILKQDMPVEPFPALTLKERKVLLNWMNMGMPR